VPYSGRPACALVVIDFLGAEAGRHRAGCTWGGSRTGELYLDGSRTGELYLGGSGTDELYLGGSRTGELYLGREPYRRVC